jgi:phenylpropionate dioxygenase-like ring-hydroxylating dioxygenase large terminal subunit
MEVRLSMKDGNEVHPVTIGAGIEELRKPLAEARHIPGYFYASPEVYELEKQRIFLKDWLPIARVEELQQPGDYMTFRVAEEPFVVARDEAGKLNAFMNRCAHRGVRVAEDAGHATRFMCPYHGWVYGLDGRLIGAPNMKQAIGFDNKAHRLKPLSVGVWAGWIFVSLAEEPLPFEEWIEPYDKELGFLKQEECGLADKLTVEVDCNWKFPVENLMDNYHSRVLHAKTIGPTVGVERFKGIRNGVSAFTAYYEGKPMTKEGTSRFGSIPWLADKGERFACSAHIAPNMQLFARSDSIHPFVMWPVGVDKVRITCYMLWPKEWHAQSDFREKVAPYNEFTRQVMNEDVSVMESLHDAAKSPFFKPGRMSDLELGVYNLLNYNVDRALGLGDPKLY